jgi:hypothetical protein
LNACLDTCVKNSVKYWRVTADAYTDWRPEKPGLGRLRIPMSPPFLVTSAGAFGRNVDQDNLSLFSQPPVFPGLRIGLIALTESAPTYCCAAALGIKGLGALGAKRSRFPSNYSMASAIRSSTEELIRVGLRDYSARAHAMTQARRILVKNPDGARI